MKYSDKKVLVCGMGMSGIAAARLLLQHGALVRLADMRQNPAIPADLAGDSCVSTYFGGNPDSVVTDFDMLVLSPGIATHEPFVVKALAAGVAVIGEVELASQFCTAPIIAITGTNGKTTTTSMVGDIMRMYAPDSQVVGNIGIPFCGLAEQVAADAFIVAEVSSFQLETIDKFRPKVSAVLNMTEDHLNRHITMDAYIAAKERIYENQRREQGDIVVLNFDNEITRHMAAKTRAEVLWFSTKPIEPNEGGVFLQKRNDSIWINWRGYNHEVMKTSELNVPGDHNLENAMAAIAITAAAGVPLELIAEGLRRFEAVEHRLEFVRELGGVRYYNDSKATNTDSAIKGLAAMTRPVVLIAGGQDKGLDFGMLVSRFAGRVKRLIVIGETREKIAQACRDGGFVDFEYAESLEQAVTAACGRAVAGDCVLLSPACASFDMFASFEERGRVFKEKVMELVSSE